VLEKNCQAHFSNRTTPEPSVCLSSYFQEGQKLEENILYLSLLGTDEGHREDQTEQLSSNIGRENLRLRGEKHELKS
jgi:hypothetical protein